MKKQYVCQHSVSENDQDWDLIYEGESSAPVAGIFGLVRTVALRLRRFNFFELYRCHCGKRYLLLAWRQCPENGLVNLEYSIM